MKISCVWMSAAAIAAVMGSADVWAGNAVGVIDKLIVRDTDGLTYVQLTTSPASRASCAAATTYWMIQNENSESGRKLYAMLLAAHLTGRTVSIVGTNTCVRWGDGEDIQYVVLQQ
jgi:hypothetical protein